MYTHICYVRVQKGVSLLSELAFGPRTMNRDRAVHVGGVSSQLCLSVTHGFGSGRRFGRFYAGSVDRKAF